MMLCFVNRGRYKESLGSRYVISVNQLQILVAIEKFEGGLDTGTVHSEACLLLGVFGVVVSK